MAATYFCGIWSAAGVLWVREAIKQEIKTTMKTRTKTLSLFFAASVGVVLTMQPLNGRADDKQVATDEFSRAVNDGYDVVIINGELRWREKPAEPATIKTVVAMLGSRYQNANIVYAPELAEVGIPDLKLRAHDLPEMLEALRVASGNKFDWLGPRSPEVNVAGPPIAAIDPATGLPVAATPTADASSGLFVLREPTRAGQNERVVEACNIQGYIERKIHEDLKGLTEEGRTKFGAMAADQLQSLILGTVASFKQVSEDEVRHNLKFQYHAGATLLVIIGPQDDVEVARKVVNALTGEGTASGGGSSGSGTSFRSHMEKIVTGAGGASGGTGGGGSPGEHEPLSTEVLVLKYADVSTATQTAFALLTDSRSKIVPDQRAKTLVVVATPPELTAIKKAIEQLDLASKPSVGDSPPKAH
jgi:hypothetical protein